MAFSRVSFAVLLSSTLFLGAFCLMGLADLAGLEWRGNPMGSLEGKSFVLFLLLLVCTLRLVGATRAAWRRRGKS